MDKEKFRSTLSDISDELFAIERDMKVVDALQEEVWMNVFNSTCLEDALISESSRAAFTFTARQKSYFADAACTYIKRLLDNIMVLRQRVESLMEEGDLS